MTLDIATSDQARAHMFKELASFDDETKSIILKDGKFIVGTKKNEILTESTLNKEGWVAYVLEGTVKICFEFVFLLDPAFIAGKGRWVNLSTFSKGASPFTIKCLTPCAVWAIPFTAAQKAANSGYGDWFLRSLSRELSITLPKGVTLSQSNTASVLLSSLLDIWKEFPDSTEKIPLTDHELSYISGLSRQTINKTMKSFETLGFIKKIYGGFKVIDRVHAKQHFEKILKDQFINGPAMKLLRERKSRDSG